MSHVLIVIGELSPSSSKCPQEVSSARQAHINVDLFSRKALSPQCYLCVFKDDIWIWSDSGESLVAGSGEFGFESLFDEFLAILDGHLQVEAIGRKLETRNEVSEWILILPVPLPGVSWLIYRK